MASCTVTKIKIKIHIRYEIIEVTKKQSRLFNAFNYGIYFNNEQSRVGSRLEKLNMKLLFK